MDVLGDMRLKVLVRCGLGPTSLQVLWTNPEKLAMLGLQRQLSPTQQPRVS
jgi:hypothetical protein